MLSHTQNTYVVDPQYPVHDINSHLVVRSEEDRDLTKEEILLDTAFTGLRGNELPKWLSFNKVYWGKVHLNILDSLQGWTLHFEDFNIGAPAWTKSNGKIDVYAYVNDLQIFHKKSGVEYPRKERDIKSKWMVNRISIDDLPVNEDVTIIMRVEGNSIGFPASFKLSLRSPKQAHYHEIYQPINSFNIFMFGASFIIFLYHFLQFLYLREKIFFWFTMWLLFCTITMAMSVGHIIGSFQNFRFPVWALFANGMMVPFWFFGREFVNTHEKYPKLDKVILILAAAIAIEIIGTAIYVIIADPLIIGTSVGIHYPILFFFNLIGLFISVYLILKKDAHARYFGVGVLIGNFAFFMGLLYAMGIIRPPVDPFAWSIFLQMIIYSFGIAFRRQRLGKKAEDERLEAQRAAAEVSRIKDLDEIKSKFFANISHEFRTPLSLISGPIEHAIRKDRNRLDDDQPITLSAQEYSIIKKNTNRLQTLVDQLLDISKIESGQIHLSLTRGSLIHCIRTIVAAFESLAESRNISLNTSYPEDLSEAFYDRDKLEKVIINLVSNAFKYTGDGGVVSVGVNFEGDYYSVEISDTGKGINQSELNKIFDRFYRIEGSEVEGSGIGLALTKELVDLHNGKIKVSSTLGQGTTFKVKIPFTLELLPKVISTFENSPDEVESLPSIDSVGVEKPTVEEKKTDSANLPVALIVEDNSDLQMLIQSMLSENYRCLLAKDGLQGERMAFEHVPDIIISDVMMPGKDGYELCNALKTNVKTSHVPIIILTAKAGHNNKIEGLTVGADAFLTKPFDEGELLIRMKNLLDARQSLWQHFKSLDVGVLSDLELISAEDKFLQEVIQTIQSNLDNEALSVEDLARQVGFSRSQLHRKLKAITNKSAIQLITEIRLKEAFRMLENNIGSVSEIAYSVGYNNMSYFTKSFKEHFGILPSKVKVKS